MTPYLKTYWDSHLEKLILMRARRRAKKFGVEFNITESDIVIPKRCPVLGIRMSRRPGRACADSPSLDRINPKRGYVRGNVWVISWRANRLKGDATVAELERLVRAIKIAVAKPPPA